MNLQTNGYQPKPLVLCLGSDIISDDGFGPAVGALLKNDPTTNARADIETVALAGFALLDLIHDRRHVLIVDSVDQDLDDNQPTQPAGTLIFFQADQQAITRNLIGSHQLSLPMTMSLGYKMGYCMPYTVDILACQAFDLRTLSEQLTPAVELAVPTAANRVIHWVDQVLANQAS